MSLHPSPFFSGNNRIEFSPLFGRPIRMGLPEQLLVSDTQSVINHLKENNTSEALNFSQLLSTIYDAVVGTFLEWCIDIPHEVSKFLNVNETKKILDVSYKLFSDALKHSQTRYTPSSISTSLRILDPSHITHQSIFQLREQRAKGITTYIDEFLSEQRGLYAKFLSDIEANNFTEAEVNFRLYVSCARAHHDLMGHYISVIGGVLSEYLPQASVVEILQEGLESCPVLEHMWKAFETLPPDALAAMLAEHLRAHYSGAGREGSVRITEDDDVYRLVFEPCGTGGAMRRDKIKGLTVLSEASPETWGRSGEVPPYCAHCAKNEITSIERIGFPVWVTEFDPDPSKPCGWTVYKDPKKIPESYFNRLGFKKDINNYKK